MKKVLTLMCLALPLSASLYASLSGSTEWRDIPQFAQIPLADEAGIVLQEKIIPFPRSRNIFNPGLVRKGDGYILAVREALPWTGWPINYSNIVVYTTDEEFQLLDQGKTLHLIDEHSQDPRVFYVNDSLYLTFHHVTDASTDWKTELALAKLDSETFEPFYSTPLFFSQSKPREKNWVPFTIPSSGGKENLFFVYSYNPFKVLRLTNERVGGTELCYDGGSSATLTSWEKKFGSIRGGTQAIALENGEYLAFFHTFPGGYSHYAMGAITFQVNPFRITKISPYPILYPGLYDSHEGYNSRAIIFPGGLVEDTNENGKAVFHVACGVNDVAVKIITMDKAALLNSLVPVE